MIVPVITINLLVLAAVIITAAVLGFAARSRQLTNCRNKISELEQEMLANHAHILELQKEKATLTSAATASNIPVIAMKKLKDDTDQAKSLKAKSS